MQGSKLYVRVCLAAGLLLALPAGAMASGLYGGLAGVYTDFDDARTDSRFGYRLYAGYDFITQPMFRLGVEGGYTRTGTFRTDNGTRRFQNTDIGLQATVTPVPRFSVHGRVGQEWGDSDGTLYAVGGSLGVLPLTRIRAEYQNRNDFDAVIFSVQVRLP